ncbi:MAG TPA: ribonuclease HII [Ignavibacteriaceae bacterium]|nr:ribonuclease HII [Ignavibacteriaceae bacterium]
MKNFDNSFLDERIKFIAGVDEAGRGPLAGPVVAASVIYSPETFFAGINDSKKLTENKREEMFPEIISHSICCSVSVVSHGQIDRINILRASLLAMFNAVSRLEVKPHLILADGNKKFTFTVPVIPIVKGDSKSFAIASASIIAKVVRDRIMKRLDQKFPEYLWAKNKGYPTQEHIKAVKLYGPSPLHRKTFLKNILPEFSTQDNLEVSGS